MNRPVKITSRPQLALQSYLDNLLMEATEELPLEVEAVAEVIEVVETVELEAALDEFQAAVLEELTAAAGAEIISAELFVELLVEAQSIGETAAAAAGDADAQNGALFEFLVIHNSLDFRGRFFRQLNRHSR